MKLLSDAAVAPPIVGRTRRSWDDFYRVAEAVQRLLVDERLPLVRRLVHCVRFCNLLEQCKLKRVGTESLDELIEAMEQLACSDAGHLFQDRQPPSKRTARLFRRLGGAFHSLCSRRPADAHAGRSMASDAAQWSVGAGASVLPELHPRFPAISLDQLERPLGPLSADVLQPLNRFYEAHAISKRYALAPPGGSLVDSVRRLAFAFPMSLWMLRWLAARS